MTGKEYNMYSKKTEKYGFPQYLPYDHPDFLTDFNSFFERLDVQLSSMANEIETLKQRISILEKED